MYIALVILSIGVLISAILTIINSQSDNAKRSSAFKLLTTILIISIAIIINVNVNSFYSAIIIVALVFSLIGDFFLTKKKYFLYGLSSFLLAHIGFTIGFAGVFGFNWAIAPLIVLIIIGAAFFIYLKKDLAKLAIPVAIYISVIIIMNWQAIGLVYTNNEIVFIGMDR